MRDRSVARAAALLLATAWLTGCTGSSTGASPAASTPGASSAPSGPAASANPTVPADVLDPIVNDAATRAGVDQTTVTVTAATARTWPNGALGCPEPGVMYTQAVVTGWQVVVEAGGTPYDYRSSGAGRSRLCSSGAGAGGSPAGSSAPG